MIKIEDPLGLQKEFDAWFKEISSNAGIDYERKVNSAKYKNQVKTVNIERTNVSFMPTFDLYDVDLNVMEFFDSGPIRIEDDDIFEALGILNETERQVIILKFFHGLTAREIASK